MAVRYGTFRICIRRTSHFEPYRTSVPYFSSIFEAYRTRTITKQAYRTSVPYFLAKIEAYRTYISQTRTCNSETRTNDKNIHSVALPGYSFYSNNSFTKAGGVGMHVVDSFYYHEITNLRLNLLGCEDVCIEVNLNDKTNLVVCTVY